MSEKLEEANSFQTLNTQSGENVHGKGGSIGILQQKKILISSSPCIPEENYSIENKENYSFKMNSTNTINNTIEVVDDIFASKEQEVVQERKRLNILLQEHSKDCTWLLPKVKPTVFKLKDKQLSPRQSEYSSPVSNCSRNSYAEMLKYKSSPNDKIEVNHLKNVLGNNSRLNNEEVEYLVGDYETPFGVIGRNVDNKKEHKKRSELQTDFSYKLNEENAFIEDQFPNISFKIDPPATDISLLNYPDTETNGLSTCFWNNFSEDNVWQNYSYKTNVFKLVDSDVFTEEKDGESSDSNNSDQWVSTNTLRKAFHFRCPLNNNPIELCDESCIETLVKDVSSSDEDTSSDSSLEHNSYPTPYKVSPIEHVEVPTNSTVSNYLNKYREIFKGDNHVLFIPLHLGLKQDAETQETDLNNSPTRKAIESELSDLWKETSQKSVDNASKNVPHPEGQGSNENIQNVQETTEDFLFCKEAQLFLNDSEEVKASRMSNLSTVITSSSLITEKGFHYTDVTNHHPSGFVSSECGQIVNDGLFMTTNNLESILDEAANILLDYDSSCDFYKYVRNEVHQEIEEINRRISDLVSL